jgi:hypothetical protein
MTSEEWTSTLKLSTMWEFADVRKLAIETMSNLNLKPTDKIILGKKYRVTPWLQQGYRALIQKPATNEDFENYGSELGWETVARILRVRDRFSQNQNWRECRCKFRGTMTLHCPYCGLTHQPTTTGLAISDVEIRHEFRSDFLDQDDDLTDSKQ